MRGRSSSSGASLQPEAVPNGQDPYLYPGTDVLRNKPGIVVAEVLAAFEYEQSAKRIEELRGKPISGRFDLKHLQDIHRAIFQDVYEWAGELRTVGLMKGGSRFAEPAYIESEAKKLSDALANEGGLRGLEKPPFVQRLAHYYGEFNALHPFREGSGRSCRELMGQLAREAGYELDQTRIDNSKGQWNAATRQSFLGNLQPVMQILSDALRPTRSVAFETLTEEQALVRHPELAGTYEGLHRLRDAYAERFSGNLELQQQYELQARGEIVRTLDAGAVLEATPPEPRSRDNRGLER